MRRGCDQIRGVDIRVSSGVPYETSDVIRGVSSARQIHTKSGDGVDSRRIFKSLGRNKQITGTMDLVRHRTHPRGIYKQLTYVMTKTGKILVEDGNMVEEGVLYPGPEVTSRVSQFFLRFL